ncbi:hypothetical protein [Legionella fairfieldensis]|uniref:hypothetical protein n=1 Tax=Legionella fairfieldensis TaxID=45064 RepID=UPI00048FFEB4|nr:hypothetical protein [Legionella fairfieldensis]
MIIIEEYIINQLNLLIPILKVKPNENHIQIINQIVLSIANLAVNPDNQKTMAQVPQLIPALATLMQQGTPQAKKDASRFFTNLVPYRENKKYLAQNTRLFHALFGLIRQGMLQAKENTAGTIANNSAANPNNQRPIVQEPYPGLVLIQPEPKDSFPPTFNQKPISHNLSTVNVHTAPGVPGFFRPATAVNNKRPLTSVPPNIDNRNPVQVQIEPEETNAPEAKRSRNNPG